jgi:hypothetical protein
MAINNSTRGLIAALFLLAACAPGTGGDNRPLDSVDTTVSSSAVDDLGAVVDGSPGQPGGIPMADD